MDDGTIGLEGLLPRAAWSRRGFVTTSLATGFALSVRPVSAAAIHTDTQGLVAGEVKIPVADGTIPAYRARPDKSGNFPTVLVIHEIWGVHEHIQDLCRRFAKLGFYAIAPELFAREGDPSKYPTIKELITNLVSKVPEDEVLSDLDATVVYARASGEADVSHLAVTGFCWGGRMTWLYAAHQPELKAAVAWYGVDRPHGPLTPNNPLDVIPELKCPVLALYGGKDQGIPQSLVEARQKACEAAHKTCEFKTYPDAPHGFNADYRPSYRADAAKDGWDRMLAWFKQYGVA
jgi:carboxymethylenebutenolidase